MKDAEINVLDVISYDDNLFLGLLDADAVGFREGENVHIDHNAGLTLVKFEKNPRKHLVDLICRKAAGTTPTP